MGALAMGDTYTIGGTKYTIGVEATEGTTTAAKAASQLSNALTVLGTSAKATVSNHLNVGEVVKIDGKSFTIAAKTNADTSEVAMTELNKFASMGSTIEYNGKSVSLFSTSDSPTDGVDKNNAQLITAKKAYELIINEFKAASNIGATTAVKDAKIKFGDDDAKSISEITAADVNAQKPTAVRPTGSSESEQTKVEFSLTKGEATVQNDLTFNLHVGSDADMTNKIGVTITDMSSTGLGIKGLNVSDATGKAATYAIDSIADAISKVSAQRSSLGAIQNRLEHTIANVDNVVENSNAAESRIRDTDMAEEMVNYSKNNILQQAGQAMLAQANQSTQGVLSILG